MPAWPSYPGRPGPMKIPPLRGSSCGPGRIRTYDQGIHLAPAFPPGVDYLFTRARPVRVGAGCSSLLSRALEPSGSLCTFRRCTGGSAQGCHGITHPEGFPEFIPSTSRVSARRHLVDESPALTAVLQAQPRRCSKATSWHDPLAIAGGNVSMALPLRIRRYPSCAAKEVDMKLYYLTGACSLASNIALRDAGLKFELVKVDRHTKKAADGLHFNEVNPKGYVPALTLDNGEALTENVAVLQYIADRNPGAQLAPAAGTMDRYR